MTLRLFQLPPSLRSSLLHLRSLRTFNATSAPAAFRHYSTPDEMGKEKGEKSGFQLKVPKGTKDWEGKDMVIRDKIFSSITEVFKRHGAVTIDTLVNLSIHM